LAKISENAILRRMATCVVSYLDVDGFRHSVEVDADGLYEAGVLAVRAFRQHDCAPAESTEMEVEVRSVVRHTINLRRINEWLHGGAKSPKEAVTKERLRGMLS
jgi:hypothetical protein